MESAECNWPRINWERSRSKRKKDAWSSGEELGPLGNADSFFQWYMAANNLLSTDPMQEKCIDFFFLTIGLIIQAPKQFVSLLGPRVWDSGDSLMLGTDGN